MTPTQRLLPPSRSVRARVEVAAAQLSALTLAAGAATLHTPLSVRLVCLAILALIPGSALTRLLLGESRHRPLLADPAIRLPLTVIFGGITLLAVVFALNTAGVPLRTAPVAVGTALLGAVLVLCQAVRRLPRFGPGVAALRTPVLACTAAATVIAAAVAGAIAMQPTPADNYTTLTFADPSWLSDQTQAVVAETPVRINWILRSFGYVPDPETTAIEVRVDGRQSTSIAIDMGVPSAPTGPDQAVELGGAVTLPAPATPGRYRVSLAVYPHALTALGERAPVTLTAWLEVSPA